jgi:hypothetical protein
MTHHHLYELEKMYDPDVDVPKYYRKCVGGNKLGRYNIPVSRVLNQNNDNNDNNDDEDGKDEDETKYTMYNQ